MEILRGDIYFVSHGITTGSEQEPGKPAVIVSNNTGNHFSNAVEVVYLTSKDKKTLPTHAKVMCRTPSTALCEQVTCVSKERLIEYVRTCTDEEMEDIDRAIMIALDLKEEPGNNDSEVEDLRKKLYESIKENERLKEIRMIQMKDHDITVIKTERDLYKNLYEQIVERMMK